MASAASKPMTAEDFYDWLYRPESEDRLFELVRGRIVEMPLRGELHGFVCAKASHLLATHVWQHRQGYACSNNTGVIVSRNPDTVRRPDVIYFADKTTLDETRRAFAAQAPALAVEVLSPEDSVGQVLGRVADLLRAGTQLVWVVEPEDQCVYVYSFAGPFFMLAREEELTGGDALPDFRCKVADLFAMPGQKS
jgi:Uma2 family endonuclease